MLLLTHLALVQFSLLNTFEVILIMRRAYTFHASFGKVSSGIRSTS